MVLLGLSEPVGGCGRSIRELAAEAELVAFEGVVFSAFAAERVDGDDHLKGQEDQPEVHAFVRAFETPPVPKGYVAEKAQAGFLRKRALIQPERVSGFKLKHEFQFETRLIL